MNVIWPCSTPEVVANAEIVSNTGFLPGGGSVTYKCSTGYKLTGGQLTLMCNLGGIWNYSKPQCTRKLILQSRSIMYMDVHHIQKNQSKIVV
jgi:hypothetical protein